MKTPQLSQYLFWDSDPAATDWEKYANSIIVRVLERGTLDDFREIRKYYGDEKIKATVSKAKYLSDRTLSFVAFFYELPKNSFACYKNKQYQIPHLTF